ncbi:MarR family winged helix-turn-helix transcriptional regulator [Actinoplanes friuliensis]|jgi:MarR family transcriptional regulator, lower aerobic nicotinate degradation pathway regulator|uniref:MarR family transcriptional regulator n=1 Tax=Actinoplanes friuliensis DSM 7358 TaxID=1246995 RepID=U5W304_9ACTN|nr:MarR family transcriptional regulator [Actinoplanes friuliensis]AGZ42306.1 MarR family transcriptional regulator [Actinoplanes friuliensis DSM 7358]
MDHLPSWLLTQTAAYAHRLVGERFAEIGARGYHYRLLSTLIDDGPASQADLGRRTAIHFSDVVAALNELAADGYVERRPDPDDKRRNTVTVTPRGQERAVELAAKGEEIQDELLAPLSAADRKELVRLLTLLRRGGAPG